MIKVLYYYYFLFYKKILKDDEPHMLATMALSASEALLVNYTLDFLGVHFFCRFLLGKWEHIGILLIILVSNYVIFHRTGKAKDIVKQKPKFFESHYLSLSITIIFFIITTSFPFWMADYLLNVMEKCK